MELLLTKRQNDKTIRQDVDVTKGWVIKVEINYKINRGEIFANFLINWNSFSSHQQI